MVSTHLLSVVREILLITTFTKTSQWQPHGSLSINEDEDVTSMALGGAALEGSECARAVGARDRIGAMPRPEGTPDLIVACVGDTGADASAPVERLVAVLDPRHDRIIHRGRRCGA